MFSESRVRGALGVGVFVKHPPLPQRVASSIQFLDARVLGLSNGLAQWSFGLPVHGPERARALEHQVLEKVRRPEFSRLFDDRSEIREDLGGDARVAGALDNEQAQAVVEDVLCDSQVVQVVGGRLLGRESRGEQEETESRQEPS